MADPSVNDTEKQPLVSIVIPAWNAERYVKEAVESALAQTYPRCEVIVVDDGSVDGTKNVLEPYIRDHRIIYIHQANKGLAGARNTGIRTARGAYIALLDSDDAFMPEKMERQVRALEEHAEYGACYSDLIHFTDTTPRKYFHHRYTYPSGDILEPLLHRQFLNPLTLVVRKAVFENDGYFDESLRRSEDWELWLRWARAGVKFLYVNEQFAYYRMRTTGNLSDVQSEPAMKSKNLELFTRFGKTLTAEEWRRYQFDDILRRLKTKVVFAYLMVGDKVEAAANAGHLSSLQRFLVEFLPASFWRFVLVRWRTMKHRLLLRKLA